MGVAHLGCGVAHWLARLPAVGPVHGLNLGRASLGCRGGGGAFSGASGLRKKTDV